MEVLFADVLTVPQEKQKTKSDDLQPLTAADLEVCHGWKVSTELLKRINQNKDFDLKKQAVNLFFFENLNRLMMSAFAWLRNNPSYCNINEQLDFVNQFYVDLLGGDMVLPYEPSRIGERINVSFCYSIVGGCKGVKGVKTL